MIKIVTDTAVSLPPDLTKQHEITLLGGYVQFGEERFADHFEISGEQFYQKLLSARVAPVSIDPTPDAFKVIYRSVLTRFPGAEIVSVHCTSQLSTVVEAARVAAASFPGESIHIFDTLSVGGAQGLMVLEAAQLAERGTPVEGILARLTYMRPHVMQLFTLDTLDFLALSGRVGQVGRLIGNLLDVKPVLALVDGRIEPHSQYRSRARVLEALRDTVIEAGQGRGRIRMGVVHADCLADAERLAGELDFVLKPELLFVSEVSIGVGAVSGPGGLGVAWYIEPAEDAAT